VRRKGHGSEEVTASTSPMPGRKILARKCWVDDEAVEQLKRQGWHSEKSRSAAITSR